ncbi:MAG: NADP-dependent malic enzyme [Clostridiales Family XIII bacterium]|jgi:malate dehydrogenase (oxaloacetate-decarboxylating)|nr:NADP-dependent malic enzyme [Clostridiales Family XIII bacterium]
MNFYDESLKMHEENSGKMEIISRVPINNKADLSIAYTPGVAQPCLEIHSNPDAAYTYTPKGRMVAVVSDGSAVLGLGNIGGLASIPVMEGKAVLFKAFGGVDAVPICLKTQDIEEIINIVKNISPVFGGINLEDISAPRCFEIERRLQEELDIPVFHDDQHGTAIVVSAAIINSFKLLRRPLRSVKVAVNGAGAAGTAIVKMLLSIGIHDIVICDSSGLISTNRLSELSMEKIELLELTNKSDIRGGLAEAVRGRDLFIGVSGPRLLTGDMVASMSEKPVIFAMSNPEPEIMPDIAQEAGAFIIGTGRSDFPNQINNVLVFPGIFKGALAARASRITEKMKVAAAYALAGCISDGDLSESYIIPGAFEPGVADAVAGAVAKAWLDDHSENAAAAAASASPEALGAGAAADGPA